jgi:hypothetical protein
MKTEVSQEIEHMKTEMPNPSANRAWMLWKEGVGSKVVKIVEIRGDSKAEGKMTSLGKLLVLTAKEGVEGSCASYRELKTRRGNDR